MFNRRRLGHRTPLFCRLRPRHHRQLVAHPAQLRLRRGRDGRTLDPATFTLTNTGEADLPAPRVDLEFERPEDYEGQESGIFEDSAFDCAVRADLKPGESCTVTLTFQPANRGPRNGTIRFVDPGSELSPATASFSGVGIGPIVSFSPPLLSLGSLPIGEGPPFPKVLTVSNSGDSGFSISGISLVHIGDNPNHFAIVGGSCHPGGTVAPGASCTIQAVFSPTQVGFLNGELQITDNAARGFQIAELQGIGFAPVAAKTWPLAIFFSQRPHKVSTRRFATFRFGLSGAHVQFVCKLDRRPFRPCVSPRTYRNLANGHHVFKVKALPPPPGVSPAPAMARFQVIPRRAG